MTTAEINVRVLLALGVVIAASRFAGWAISKIGQPRVHGEILAGILLGPSLLGVVWPEALAYLFPPEVIGALKVLAQVGLVLFMFMIGLELDLGKLRGHGHKAVVISHASIIAPMLLGAGPRPVALPTARRGGGPTRVHALHRRRDGDHGVPGAGEGSAGDRALPHTDRRADDHLRGRRRRHRMVRAGDRGRRGRSHRLGRGDHHDRPLHRVPDRDAEGGQARARDGWDRCRSGWRSASPFRRHG